MSEMTTIGVAMSDTSRHVVLDELFGERGSSAVLAFVRTAQDGSFACAARQLNMTASGVAKAVQRLEQRIGRPLFARTTRSLKLTETGSLLLRHAQHILEAVTAAEAALSESTSQPRGPLRVSMAPAIGRAVVLPMLDAFVRRYPEIQLDLALESRRVDLVAEGFDLVLRTGQPTDSTLRGRSLGKEVSMLVAAPTYLEETGIPREPADLVKHRCIRYRNPDKGRVEGWPLHELSTGSPVQVPITLVSTDSDAVRLLALAGAGIASLPYSVTGAAVDDGRLVPVLRDFVHQYPHDEIWLLWPADRHHLPKVRVFIDFIVDAFSHA
ncbi:LysR substrate-binding domain-containing protein [Paraburkholderia sp. IW21]|uniref:LysR family transcriptional regulator n=1 Tax=Paraburkholderia sp. IW21 TaxID=3242488 RepID=UPI0035216BED